MEPNFYEARYLIAPVLGHKTRILALPRQAISYMDLTYCLEGYMEYIYEDKLVVLHSGDAILFPQGSYRQRLYTENSSQYASFNVQFKEDFIPPFSGHLPQCVRSDTGLMLEIFCRDFNSASPMRHKKCASIFSYLYYQLMETVIEKENPHIHAVKQYVFSNLSRTLTLEEAAEEVHLAPTYLCALFKKHTGQTFVEYVLAQKMEYAKRLMVVKELSLCEIAENCGYEDYKYFSYSFKKITGMTPTEYRRRMQKMV